MCGLSLCINPVHMGNKVVLQVGLSASCAKRKPVVSDNVKDLPLEIVIEIEVLTEETAIQVCVCMRVSVCRSCCFCTAPVLISSFRHWWTPGLTWIHPNTGSLTHPAPAIIHTPTHSQMHSWTQAHVYPGLAIYESEVLNGRHTFRAFNVVVDQHNN